MCISLVMIIIAIILQSKSWDQDILFYVTDEWDESPIVDVTSVTYYGTCPSGYDVLTALFYGTKTACLKKKTTGSGYESDYTMGSCPKKSGKVSGI